MTNNVLKDGGNRLPINSVLATLDALPRRVRLRLQYAPVFLDPCGIAKLVKYGCSEEEILDLLEQNLPRLLRQQVIEIYGPDHPQAA